MSTMCHFVIYWFIVLITGHDAVLFPYLKVTVLYQTESCSKWHFMGYNKLCKHLSYTKHSADEMDYVKHLSDDDITVIDNHYWSCWFLPLLAVDHNRYYLPLN